MTSCTKHFKKWLMLLATILVVQVAAKAQIVVQGYGQLNAQPDGAYTVCGAPETDTINLKNTNGGNISAINITLHLPPGGSYVAGSIMASGTGVTGAVDATISNLNAPVITVNGSVASNNTFKIWYKKTFTCPVIAFQAGTGHLTQETLDFSYTGGAAQTGLTTVGTYSVVAASLNLTTVTNQAYTGLVGDSYTQTYTMVNGGQGCTSTAYLVLDNGAGTYSFSAPTSGTLSHDTLFFAPADMPGGDLKWCNGETKTVTVTTKILNCNQLLRNSIVGWGCGAGSYCQPTTASNSHNSNVTITNLTPNLTATVPNPNYNYCMSGELVKQTVRIVNTGAGPASNIVLSTQNYYPGNFGGLNYLDTTATWQVKDKNGNVIGTLHNFTGGAQASYANASCTIVSGYTDLQVALKGILLLPNDTIYVDVWSRMVNISCPDYNCQTKIAWFGLQTKLDYKDQCGNGSNTEAFKGQVARTWTYFEGSLTSPTDVLGGSNFNLDIFYTTFYTSGNSPSGNGSTYIAMPLTGTDMVPTASTVNIQALTLPVFVRNDSMIIGPIPQNVSISNNHLVIPMKANCGTGGIKSINISTVNKYDACAPASTFGCFNASINIHCPNPCPIGGATPMNFTLKRINYGLVDNNNDGIADASGSIDLTKIALDHSVNGDTLQGTWNIKVYANATTGDPNINKPFTHTYIDFQLDPLGSGLNNSGTLNPVPAAVVAIYPAGGGAVINCTVTPTIVGNIAHYDFTTCKALWNLGDSMVVKANFTVNETNSNRYNGTTYSGFDLFVTQNQVYSSYAAQATPTTAPINNTTYTCDHFNDYNQMSRIWLSSYEPVNQIINGCTNNLISSMRQYTRGQEAPNIFPYEVRNFWIIDTMKVVIPHGFVFRNNSATFRRDQFLPNTTVNIANANVLQIADTLYFINLKKLYKPFGGTLDVSDEAEVIYINFSIDPTCNAVTGSAFGGTQSFGQGNGLNTPSLGFGDNSVGNGGFNGSANMYVYNAPQPVLAGGGSVTTNTGTASWSIQMQNLSNATTAANSYLYITPANSFTNIVISEGGTPLVKTAAGFYQLGDLAASASRTFTVTGQLGSCSKDSFRIYQGWGCSGYPTSFTAGTCNQYTWLVASGYNAGLDATFNRVGTGDITLCNPPFSVEALINSTLTGNLGSDSLRVILPAFTNYAPGTDSIGNYPTGTAYAATALNPTIIHAATGDTLIFALNTKTGGVGLTGVGDGTHSQVKVKFSIATQCGFTSGTPIKALVSGVSVCGDPTAVVSKSTNAITLAGANPTDQFAITYTATSTPCTVTATVSIKNTGAAPTLANDSLIITLPAGALLAGATTNIHNAAGLVAATNSSASVYKWPVPTGMAVNDSMTFSFPIDLTQVACGPQISTANAIQNVSLSCNGTACLTPVIVGGKDVTIIVTKPTLVITNIVAQNINGWPSGGSGTLAVTLTNTSTVDVPASTYNVEYFCGSSTTPMAAALFPAAVPAGATVTANMSVIASSTCLPGTIITGKIRPVGAFGAVCLCNPSSFTMLAPLPVNLINLSASKLTTSQVKIGWQVGVELNLASYDVERSTDGSTFNKVNNTAATGRTNYSSLDNIAGVSSKNVYYRLKMINKDGTFKYSQIVKVNTEFTDMGMVIYPNPVRNQMLVTINSGITQKAELRLVNNLGQTLQTQQLNLVTGSNSVTVDNINRLPAAAYLVVVYFSNGDVQRAKVIKE